VVELLVEVGNAQLNKQDHDGLTALHCVAQYDELEQAKYLVARGCSLTVQDNDGCTALNLATRYNFDQLAEFLAIASNLTTARDYISLRTLCAPCSASRVVSLNSARQLRDTSILAARHARRIHDDPSLHTPIDPVLLRIALLPSANNRTPNTEGQVFRCILSFVGTGFDCVEEEVEEQAASMNREAHLFFPLQQTIAAQQHIIAAQKQENATLQQTIAAQREIIAQLTAALASSS
jgi:hypothetical protein